MDLIGKVFYDNFNHDKKKVVQYLEQFKKYHIYNYRLDSLSELLDREEIERGLAEKDRIEKVIKLEKEEKEKKRKLDEIREKELNNSYGYIESLDASNLQKGRILKVLNREEIYDDLGIMKRKDYHYNKSDEVLKIEDNKVYYTETLYIEVTKTEVDYIKYLIRGF